MFLVLQILCLLPEVQAYKNKFSSFERPCKVRTGGGGGGGGCT